MQIQNGCFNEHNYLSEKVSEILLNYLLDDVLIVKMISDDESQLELGFYIYLHNSKYLL